MYIFSFTIIKLLPTNLLFLFSSAGLKDHFSLISTSFLAKFFVSFFSYKEPGAWFFFLTKRRRWVIIPVNNYFSAYTFVLATHYVSVNLLYKLLHIPFYCVLLSMSVWLCMCWMFKFGLFVDFKKNVFLRIQLIVLVLLDLPQKVWRTFLYKYTLTLV